GQEGRKWNGPPAGTRTWRRRRDHDGAPIGTRRAAPRDATAPTAPRDAPHALPAGARRPRPPRARGAPDAPARGPRTDATSVPSRRSTRGVRTIRRPGPPRQGRG